MGGIVDITNLQTDPPSASSRFKLRSGKVLKRDPKTVTGIVVHQTGTDFIVSSRQVKNAGGDRHEALHRRALGVPVHVTVFHGKAAGVDCNHAVHAVPLDWYAYHADELNSRSLGIEIEGSYPGIMTIPKMSDAFVQAARDGIRYLVTEGRRMGMPIKYVWAHRQSSKDRGNDPGSEIWRKVVLEYAVPVLGLELQPDLVVGDGKPIPATWGREGVITAGGVVAAAALGVGGFFLLRALRRRRAGRRGRGEGSAGFGGGFGVFGR